MVMERDDDLTALPLVDDPRVKDVFAEFLFCTGLNFVHGNLHMTFASVTSDHSANRASSKRIVSARIVMPIIGAIELRDLLTQLIDALTEQGVITSEAPLPTIVTALRVASTPATIAALSANNIAISQGPVSFGKSGQVSVFVRDPDRNVIELSGREQGVVEGVTRYVP
jgi:hypothetical protein